MAADEGPLRPAARPMRAGITPRLVRIASALVGAVALGIAILIFIGRGELPACDSSRTRQTLATIFRENNVAHAGYDETREVGRGENEISCAAVVSLTDGGKLDMTYRVVREGSQTMVRASWRRRGS